jgi:hypothetical protein
MTQWIPIAESVFYVDALFTPEECAGWIERGEEEGFAPADIRYASGAKFNAEVRNNDRAEFHDAGLADRLWQRARPFLPSPFHGRMPCGVDDRLRFYRYDPGQKFDWHRDGVVTIGEASSMLSYLVFLNDDFDGGRTLFRSLDRPGSGIITSVEPRTGRALFFAHHKTHQGEELRRGRKYLLRTDVLYTAGESD